MPELPEIETIRRELRPLVCGKIFAAPLVAVPTTVEHPSPGEFVSALPGRIVLNVGRRGKYLLLELDRGILAVHLRMTGNLFYCAGGSLPPDRFLRLSMPFGDRSALHFSDMRRFGRVWLVESFEELEGIVLGNIGPDIYEQVGRERFLGLLREKSRCGLKSLLLNQGFFSGMGNIYTDEALFRSAIHPRREAGSLSAAEGEALYVAVREVLGEGIEFGGTTFRDYRSASGAPGEFQSRLKVYGRAGKRCRCGCEIEKTTVAGRGTHFCPQCQKEGDPC